MADYNFRRVDADIENDRYDEARNKIESDKKKIYSARDSVLYNLDRGILSHYAKEWNRSNGELSQAEKDIFAAFTKSISESIGAWFANDTVMTYQGETYEDIYTNIFMALNYLHLGQIDDAFVEIRRFDNKLREITQKYQVRIAEAKKNASGASDSVDSNLEFHNSALARYLSMIMYRSRGRLDEADIDRRLIGDAFYLQPRVYPFAAPQSIAGEVDIPEGEARLNIVALTGRAPEKTEEVTRFWSVDGSFYYKIALPVMRKQSSRIHAVECRVTNSKGIAARSRLELIEDISTIAIDTFKQRQALIYFRSAARSIAKSATGAVLSAVADSEDDSAASLTARLLSLAFIAVTETTERADVRTSKFFPGKAWVTGINLPPGEYDVEIDYLGAGNKTVYQQTFKDVIIGRDKLNLVETLCLR
jgi:hypothetical protein